tara:strand:- start:2354 stop:2518 length:165 start_codon:yes stop_codon:yes gene_type:complete
MIEKRTPSDNFHLDLEIAEANGISIDLVDSISLGVVEQIRDYFHSQNLREEKDK